MSTIAAGTTSGTALVNTGDTTGQLVFQTNGTTTALTLDTSQNATLVGNLTLNAQSDLRLADSDSSNWVAFQAPATVASNVTWTLPSADGTANQVLQTNGSGTLSFATPSSGAIVYLSTVTASNSATLDIETTFDSTYDMYMIVVSGLRSASDSVDLKARLKVGGSYQTTSYAYHTPIPSSNAFSYAAANAAGTGDAIGIGFANGNAAGECTSGVFYVPTPSSTALYKIIFGHTMTINDTAYIQTQPFAGYYTGATTALTGVRLYFSSGNVSSGSVRLYGIKNS